MTGAFVAVSQFAVINDKVDEVKEAFRNRPGLVDQAPGFLRMDVLSPEDAPEEIWLITYWIDRASFLAWHHSDLHRESHRFMPKGLKLDRKRARLVYLEQITE